MYQNLKWIADSHAVWDWHERLDKLPVNPPGAYFAEGDVAMAKVDILNWNTVDGEFVFEPRLRDNVQRAERTGLSAALDDDAPELDLEYDCE